MQEQAEAGRREAEESLKVVEELMETY